MAELSVQGAIADDTNLAAQPTATASLGVTVWSTFVLALVAMLAAIDRQSFSVLLVPIQKQIRVNDAAMGALTGSAFVLVYAVVAIPLARLADRTNRRNLLAVSVAVWSAATVFCGLTSSYLQLLVARIAVGSAESAQQPATMSLMGDLFSATRRGTGITFVVVGSVIGFAGGSALAGLLNDRYGWHVAMMAVGAPGLLLAVLLLTTVPEPVRGSRDGGRPVTSEPLMQSLRRAAGIKTLYPFAVGFLFLQICFGGWLIWAPAFLMRVHHLSSTKMGAIFGAVIAGATVASLVGGPLSDVLAKRGARWRLYYCCAAMVLSVPLLAASTLVTPLGASIACLFAYTLVSGGITTVSTATYVSFAPPTMRGLMTAIMNLFAAIAGGAAPFVFGAVNDALKLSYGDQSLRYTLLIAPAAMAVTCVMFVIASRTLDADVAAAGGDGKRPTGAT